MVYYFDTYPWLATLTASAGLILAALFADIVVKKLLLRLLDKLLDRSPFATDTAVRGQRVIPRLANIMPALVISWGITLVPHLPFAVVEVVRNVANAFIILTIALAISAALNVAETVYRRREGHRQKSIKSYVQVAKLILFAITGFLIIATIMDRSPLILLSGVGAMAAVLILVFQDTLLSFVASIQINSTDMVRVGDWIEVPHLDADGDVIEIALHTIKVQNFDNTVTTIPIRKLVTDPFKNWRGMQESGGRRIKRSLYIDQNSIRFLTDEEKNRHAHIGVLEDYIKEKDSEIVAWNSGLGERAQWLPNTRRMTNIGTFRAYVSSYLQNHPGLHKGMTMMTRQLQPTPEGLPIEIYCFTNTIAWAQYEGIQADIFDHLYAILPEFGLRAYQKPAGTDLTAAFRGEEAKKNVA